MGFGENANRACTPTPQATKGLRVVAHPGHHLGQPLLQGCARLKAQNLFVEHALEAEARERLWRARRNVSPALKRLAPGKLADDVVVSRSRLVPLLRFIKEAAARSGLQVACFGHLGDGNVHVNILYDPSREQAQAQALREEILAQVLALSGTISGEHGIGLTKRAYLPRELPPPVVALMRQMKDLFDPQGILNPGKIF